MAAPTGENAVDHDEPIVVSKYAISIFCFPNDIALYCFINYYKDLYAFAFKEKKNHFRRIHFIRCEISKKTFFQNF